MRSGVQDILFLSAMKKDSLFRDMHLSVVLNDTRLHTQVFSSSWHLYARLLLFLLHNTLILFMLISNSVCLFFVLQSASHVSSFQNDCHSWLWKEKLPNLLLPPSSLPFTSSSSFRLQDLDFTIHVRRELPDTGGRDQEVKKGVWCKSNHDAYSYDKTG